MYRYVSDPTIFSVGNPTINSGSTCKRLEANALEAIAIAGVDAEIVKVTDYGEIMAHGIMSTPGLVIDGRVVGPGRIPSSDDMAAWLTQAPGS